MSTQTNTTFTLTRIRCNAPSTARAAMVFASGIVIDPLGDNSVPPRRYMATV